MPDKQKYHVLLAAGDCVRGCGREAAQGSTRCSECWMGDLERDTRRLDRMEARIGFRGYLAEWKVRQIEEMRNLAQETKVLFPMETVNA